VLTPGAYRNRGSLGLRKEGAGAELYHRNIDSLSTSHCRYSLRRRDFVQIQTSLTCRRSSRCCMTVCSRPSLAPLDPRLFSFPGVPGSGKTHLAREYVWTQRECYPGGVFWIDASSHKSGCQCYWEIAQAANLVDHKNAEDTGDPEHYVYTVRRWLQRRRESLLIIFDRINSSRDGDLNYLRPFLPWDRRSSIIYTSTDRTLQENQCLFEPYHLLATSGSRSRQRSSFFERGSLCLIENTCQ
jgi:hypothetical protein